MFISLSLSLVYNETKQKITIFLLFTRPNLTNDHLPLSFFLCFRQELLFRSVMCFFFLLPLLLPVICQYMYIWNKQTKNMCL